MVFKLKTNLLFFPRAHCIICDKLAPKEVKIPLSDEYICSDKCHEEYDHLKEKAPYAGEHLISVRSGYKHHGLGDDQGGIIHYAGGSASSFSGPVCRATMEEFEHGNGFIVHKHRRRKYSIYEAIKRAESRIGEEVYHLPGNNCEHFVNWCICGSFISRQVDKVVTIVASAGTITSIALGLKAFAVTGVLIIDSGVVIFWFSDVHIASHMILYLMAAAGTGALTLALIMHWTVFREQRGMPFRECLARRIGRGAAYSTVFISTLACFNIMMRKAYHFMVDIISDPATIKHIDRAPWIVSKYSAAPAIFTVIIGYGAYKVARYFINEAKIVDDDTE